MKKFPMTFTAALALVFLAGCTTTTTWVKRDVTPLQSAKDLKLCSDKAGLVFNLTGYKGDAVSYSSLDSYRTFMGKPFEKCMKEKGYRKE